MLSFHFYFAIVSIFNFQEFHIDQLILQLDILECSKWIRSNANRFLSFTSATAAIRLSALVFPQSNRFACHSYEWTLWFLFGNYCIGCCCCCSFFLYGYIWLGLVDTSNFVTYWIHITLLHRTKFSYDAKWIPSCSVGVWRVVSFEFRVLVSSILLLLLFVVVGGGCILLVLFWLMSPCSETSLYNSIRLFFF